MTYPCTSTRPIMTAKGAQCIKASSSTRVKHKQPELPPKSAEARRNAVIDSGKAIIPNLKNKLKLSRR